MMQYFYIAVLFFIAWLVNEQIDSDNWDNLRRHYKEMRKSEEKNYDN